MRSPLFASSLSLDLSGLSKDYDVRPFTMQYNESDTALIQRLLAEEGITSLIDEAQHKVPSSKHPIQAQKLRLIDNNNQYQALERRTIRFHRSSAVEQSDSITSFIGQRSLQPTAVHIQRWQADTLDIEDGAGSVLSKHRHTDNQSTESLGLEQAWHFSPAWTPDLNGTDGVTPSGNRQVERFNDNLSNYHNSQAKQFTAISTVRDAQVGYWFEFNEHPEIEQHQGSDKEFLITAKNFYNQNNLPKDLSDQINRLLKQSHWQTNNLHQTNRDERQANTLILQRRNIPTVPAYNPQQRPVIHPQRAKVVGPSGEEIHVDEWGRIKVRFLFTRNEDHQHDGGAGSNDNDSDSAWVDVLTPWAGEGYGARFLPRIDEIVVIDFFEGDIDRPFVKGRIHEGRRHPTKFDHLGKLPDTKKLAGIKSKEYQGTGYNQLRFDDTTGQISTQLHSSHGASQLNLGKLSHPKDQAESEDRGEGFELRTDQWGAVRAGQGLLISTYKQDQAQGDHVDADIAKQQLQNSQSNAKALSDIAKNQQTDEIESIEQLKAFASEIEKDIAQFKKSVLLMNSPDGIALSTPEDIHLSADGQINQYAGDSINLSTQNNYINHALNKMSMFSVQDFKIVAVQGKLIVHSQSKGIDIFARTDIQISSVDGQIVIYAPKGVVIKTEKSQIELDDSGICSKTSGLLEYQAGQHKFVEGASVSHSAQLPSARPLKGALELFKSYGGQDFFKGTGYKVIDALGAQVSGKLDGQGFAQVKGIAPGPAKIEFETDSRSAWDQGSHFNRDYAWSDEVVGGVAGFAQNAANSLGQNMMSQLKTDLFSLNRDSLKNFGENAFKDLGDQTLGQFKEQFTQGALGAVSSALNLNLSPSQMMNVGQMLVNPNQSVQSIKDQGIDFFKDQASALFAQKNNGLISNLVAENRLDIEQGIATNATAKVTENFIKKDEYFSRFLTYTVTTRKSIGALLNSDSTPAISTQTTTTPQNAVQSTPTVLAKSTSKYELEKGAIRMDLEESRHLTTKVTVRKSTPEEHEIYNARNK